MATTTLEKPEDLQLVYTEVAAAFVECDYVPALTDFLVDLESAHADYFAAEQDPLGNAWAPLAASTIAAKGHDSILVDTNDMMNSLVNRTGDSIREVFREGYGNQHSLVFGTSDEKSMRHMTGTSRMPARPHVGVTDQLLDTLCESLADATVEELLKGK